MTRAVFLDRDGTLISDPGFLGDPAGVELLPKVATALQRLTAEGLCLIVVSNQSGIGRGLLTAAQVVSVNDELDRQLKSVGVEIAGWYWCPHLPSDNCECRKPGTANHRLAATENSLDLSESWCVGDRESDVVPATALGGHSVLVLTGDGKAHAAAAQSLGIPVVDDLNSAADLILGCPPKT